MSGMRRAAIEVDYIPLITVVHWSSSVKMKREPERGLCERRLMFQPAGAPGVGRTSAAQKLRGLMIAGQVS